MNTRFTPLGAATFSRFEAEYAAHTGRLVAM